MTAVGTEKERDSFSAHFSVIPFSSGVIVITDWSINNTLKNDRYHETLHAEEKAKLIKDSSGRYALGTSLEPPWNQSGTTLEPEPNLTKPNITELSREGSASAPTPTSAGKTQRKPYGEYGWVRLTDEQYSRLQNDLGKAELERCITYVDESAQTTGNRNKWKDWNLAIRKCSKGGWGLNR